VGGFSGVVLTGGRSTRMGHDKAFVMLDGRPLVVRVADALRRAGAEEVLAVGGDIGGLIALGVDARADPLQGDGPLGGLLTALGLVEREEAVILATDLAWIDAVTVAALVAALDDDTSADVAAARADRLEPLCAAWRVDRSRPVVAAAHAAGERAVHRAMERLAVVTVRVAAGAVRNANTRDDLRR
jgi:molybdopterin-guanine dinucleotide biosynthesis protein A